MTSRQGAEQRPTLSLHLDYQYLPVYQYASVLRAIDGAFHAIGVRGLVPVFTDLVSERALWEEQIFQLDLLPLRAFIPPLCISETRTDESISVRFDFERRTFPSLAFEERQLTLLLPRWTGVLILLGAGLTWGISRYNDFLAAQKTQLEIQRLRYEIERMQPERIEEDPTVQFYLHQFHATVQAPNIRGTTVNDLPVGEPE